MHRRVLTAGENTVLAMIQEGYGPQNSAEKVFFTDASEAVIWVAASDGTSPLMANISNLSAWRADGTISSDDELKSHLCSAKTSAGRNLHDSWCRFRLFPAIVPKKSVRHSCFVRS
jgi:hypothetical protein